MSLPEPTISELETAWIEVDKLQKKEVILKDFNKKLEDYNSAYPEQEIKQFSNKLRFAEKVIDWGKSKYIEKLAIAKWVTELEFATYIKTKWDEFKPYWTEF